MIRLFIFFMITITFSVSSEIELYKEIRIYSPDSKVISDLNRNLHLDHVHLSDEGDLIFVVSESELDIINSLDIRYDILIDDLETFYQSRLTDNYTREFGLGSMGGYYTFDEIVYNLDLVYSECSEISTEKISIGQSFEGRDIWAIKFSDNPNSDEDEAEVLYTGLHHAREPMSYMNLFYYMYWLCDNYGTDELATNIINNREIWFVPAINGERLIFRAISDAAIVSGLIAILIKIYSNKKPKDIIEAPVNFIKSLGLDQHLSPTRSNGLASMMKAIKNYAIQYT